MENQSPFETFELQVNETAAQYLKESAKWSMFLAIMGFIGIGFMIIAALVMGTVMSSVSSMGGNASPLGAMTGYISVLYIAMALIYFFPVYYLYKYASDMKEALSTRDNESLTTAFGFLKSHHKFLGISIIVIMSLYLLIIIGAIAFGIGSRM